jgi:sialic acid synthase SpsE
MMKNEKILINNTEYSKENVLIIAELGTSHGADPVKAGELIEAAAEAGADCIKFQIVYAVEILHPNTGEVELPGGKIRLFDRFRELEVNPSFFAEMKEKVEKKGLIFLCTPFGLQSARELRELKPKCVKIASPELNYSALLREIALYNLPVLLSSGVSKLGDIEEALSVLKEDSGKGPPVCLLHCVTSYPAPERDYNLRVLKSLSSVFGVPVGLSDHSLDPCLVPALGTAMGAAVIEKHFCLSRSGSGLDDPIALPPDSFAKMVQAVRRAEKASSEATIDAMCHEHGKDLVENVLGNGIKRLAPSEKTNYSRTNRSIHALGDINEGEIIERDMIACLRTEKILSPGLPPSWEEQIIGLKTKRFIPAGKGICLGDI